MDHITPVYVVRHGETHYNAQGRLQGQLDTPLNDRGRQQAAKVGVWLACTLAAHDRVVIVSSDLTRAHDTAKAVALACGQGAPLPVLLDARLRETNLGAWQDRSWAEVEATNSAEVCMWKSDPDWAMAGGETTRARFFRVVSALHDAVRLHGNIARTAIVVVAHGGVIDDVGRLVNQVPFSRGTGLKKLNCSIAALHFAWADADCSWVAGGATVPPLRAADVHPRGAALHAAPLGETRSPWRLVQWGIVEHLADDGQPVEEGSLASDTGVKALDDVDSARA